MPSFTSSKTWLITGASQGLGLSLALAALKAGHKVLACARNVERARQEHPEVESSGGKWLKLDVTSSDTTEIVRQAVAESDGVDVVVNNAGYFMPGIIEDLSEDEIRNVISTNYIGPIRVLQGALPSMRERKSGTIVYVGSIFAFLPCPGGAMYNSTKAAGESLHETLQIELAPFNIRSIVLTAGLYRTGVCSNAPLPAHGFNQNYLEGTAVGPVMGLFSGIIADPETNMPGDPTKFGERVVEVVDGTGYGSGLQKHGRVFTGRDSLEMAQKKIDILNVDLEASRKIAASTDFDGHTGRGVAQVSDF